MKTLILSIHTHQNFFDDVLQVQKGKSDEITIRLESNDKFNWA